MKRILTVIVMVVVVGFTSVANAGDPNLRPKSPGKATSASLLGTLCPVVLGAIAASSTDDYGNRTAASYVGAVIFYAGTVVGPGLGHRYSGNSKRFWTGLGIRAGCWGSAIAITAAASTGGSDDEGVGFGAFLAATGLVTISCIYDIATADGSARKYNRKNDIGDMSVVPTFDLDRGGAGVKLSWNF